ncbi:MAG TPA: TonB-dependent receptor plug domain-containing protein, partial [Sphingobacterium sp.]|nr:TonB-dependent receptor plug domain-containing protein [Sphingobacterium sp.]
MKRFLHLITFLLLASMLSIGMGHAQGLRSISGTVRDHSGALSGASILRKGTDVRTSTGESGGYRIQARIGDTLLFSNVGYTSQEHVVGNNLSIDVMLIAGSSSIDEVVVIGYGTQTRRNVTGSVSKVDMADTENLPNTNIGQALRGRVAGVQFTDGGGPGQNGSILVRGPRSLSAGNNPLIVLDGIFFNGSLIDINPTDIESIEVLKDASAAAIYGSRAANGVIMVTSKKGKTEKPNINVNSFYGLSDWAARLQLLTPERYLEKSMEIRRLRGVPYDPQDVSTYLTISEAENYESGKTIDPFDMISQQGQIYATDVSLSGKTNNTNYYLSAAMSRAKGIVYNDNIRRMAFRVNMENKITDWLKIGTNTMFSENDQSGVPASVNLAKRSSPYGTWYREDGTPTQFTVPEDQGVSSNPMRNSFLQDDANFRNNLFANFFTLIDIPRVEGLTF